jgi:hypothetical protein
LLSWIFFGICRALHLARRSFSRFDKLKARSQSMGEGGSLKSDGKAFGIFPRCRERKIIL